MGKLRVNLFILIQPENKWKTVRLCRAINSQIFWKWTNTNPNPNQITKQTIQEIQLVPNGPNPSRFCHWRSSFADNIGLNRTGYMSFLTGQNRTPKFAGQVLPDRTESGLISLNILPTKYGLSILIR